MYRLVNKFVFSFLVLVFMSGALAQSQTTFGGEIPWPLSVQHSISASNSKGLWEVKHQQTTKLLNVEISEDTISGFDWIRVSELEPETYNVIAWGEGFFSPGKSGDGGPQSSFSSVAIGSGLPAQDTHGRYITMFPNNSGLEGSSYLLRIVEVETLIGNVLGVSVIEYKNQEFDHMLGRRLFENPLACVENEQRERLSCYLGLDTGSAQGQQQ